MTLLAGNQLNPKRFFRKGNPVQQASSFDLTIGHIYDDSGTEVGGPFILQPGHIVQVASAESFNLPATITGHVTFKTSLTSNGIWALTVGIVDPGWDGPVSTTLLNFSKVEHPVNIGDAFLRVSFLEHEAVPEEKFRKAPLEADYLRSVQNAAAVKFPDTFLNSKNISKTAGLAAVKSMRNQMIFWIPALALLFATIQVFAPYAPAKVFGSDGGAMEEVKLLRNELKELQNQLGGLKQTVELAASAKPQQENEAQMSVISEEIPKTDEPTPIQLPAASNRELLPNLGGESGPTEESAIQVE